MPAISREEVAHLARLSRLALSDQELDEFAGQIDEIINHVQAGPGSRHWRCGSDEPSLLALRSMRQDVVKPTLTAEEALDQAPSQQDQRFEVPQILGE